MEWIKIKDKHPNDSEPVFFKNENTKTMWIGCKTVVTESPSKSHYFFESLHASPLYNGNWESDDPEYIDYQSRPTHWLPFPSFD